MTRRNQLLSNVLGGALAGSLMKAAVPCIQGVGPGLTIGVVLMFLLGMVNGYELRLEVENG